VAKKVAVIGSGPAGLTTADQLNHFGHTVTVYEKDDEIGGLLMYGIPNMKLDKKIVKRRIDLMEKEGVKFITSASVGTNVDAKEIVNSHDAVVLSIGAGSPRDLRVPGRQLKGIHYALPFLAHSTRFVMGKQADLDPEFSAKGKNVVVIGGGDTGCDCIGTSIRQGCKSLVNFELLPSPPFAKGKGNLQWPERANIFRVDYGHEEIAQKFGEDPRTYCISTKECIDDGTGQICAIKTIQIDWKKVNGRWEMTEVAGTEKTWPADLVLLAMGYLGPVPSVAEKLGVKADARTNFASPNGKYGSSVDKVFVAGDCHRGQSLVVWAIAEGRGCADQVNNFLTVTPISF